MEDDLNILKVEYLSNHWLDFPQILKLSLEDQTKIKNSSNEDDLQWKTTLMIKSWISQEPLIEAHGTKPTSKMPELKTTSNYTNLNISETTDRIFFKIKT